MYIVVSYNNYTGVELGMKTLEVLEKVLKGKRLAENSQRNYKLALGSLAEYTEEFPVSGVVINEWLQQLELRDTTVRLYVKLVKAAANYMKKAWKLENPFDDGSVENPSVERRERRFLSVEEVVNLAKACQSESDQLLIAVLLDSPCRIGELASLRVENMTGNAMKLKGKTGQRKYRLDPMLGERLRVLAGEWSAPFHYEDGSPKNKGSLAKRVRHLMKRSGLKGEKLGPHTLRHTVGTLVARKTGSSLMVKSLLQHDDVDTSMMYIHEVEDELALGLSPLQIIGEEFNRENGGEEEYKQIGFGEEIPDDTRALVPLGAVVAGEAGYDIESALYPEVVDGIGIRPLLKTEDVRLLRRICVWYERNGESSSDKVRARDLMRRMLRKVK